MKYSKIVNEIYTECINGYNSHEYSTFTDETIDKIFEDLLNYSKTQYVAYTLHLKALSYLDRNVIQKCFGTKNRTSENRKKSDIIV